MSLLSGTCMTGDIWSSGVFSFESPLKDLLDSGDYTLEQLLAEDELLQEIRGVHPKLLEFFGTEHAVTGLVLYMIQSPHVDPQQLQQQHEQQQQEQQQDGATTTTATTTTIPAGPPNSLTQAMQQPQPPHATPLTEKEPGAWLLPEREDGDEQGHSRAAAATALQHQRYQQQQQLQQQMHEPLTPEEEYDLYHVRFPYMSCEVVCCEVNAVIDLLADGLVDPTVYEEEEEVEEGLPAPAELMVVAATPIVDVDDATPPLLADAADADLPHESSLELEALAPPTPTTTGTTSKTTTTTPAASDVPPSRSSPPRRRRRLLDLLFSVLFDTKPGDLDDYRAGYLEKIFSVLLRKRPQTLSDYINQGGEYGRVALQKAFVTHLYSHSIMQILQRLLLPASGSSNSNTNNNSNNNNKGNKNGPNQQQQQQDDDEDDDLFADSSEDPYGNPDDSGNNGGGASTFRCTWGESTQVLELLLSSLLPTKEEVVAIAASASTKEELEDAEERRLCQSQHAAEVLMAIIQNSSLSSPLLEALLSDPALGRIVQAATTTMTIGDHDEDASASSSSSNNNQTSLLSSWSPHDSLMTCALNVLESLILQLGGYGAAPPPPPPTTDQGEDKPPDYHRSKGRGGGSPGSSSTSSSAASSALTLRTSASGIGADPTSTLMEYLPLLLDAMSKLLRHSACDTWTSPMQFSTNKQHARKILGSSRLRIVRLLESLVLLGNTKVDDLLCQSNGLKICLELFWEFPWCSTLHQSVANLLVHIFEGANARGQLQEYFVVKCDLLRLLMDAFYESTATNHTTTSSSASSSGHVVVHAGAAAALTHPQHVVVNLNDEVPPAGGSAASTTSDPEDMIVSDEDIDAAIERQLEAAAAAHTGGIASAASSMVDKASMEALDPDSRDGSTALVDTPSQSVRLGYMGHVIIICQALVHACTKQQGNGAKDSKSDSIKKPGFRGLTAATARNWESKINGDHNAAAAAAATNLLPEKDEDDYGPRSKASSAASVESLQPLVLAQLIDSHPLKNRWNDFVVTTLASETSIQSTPLGGTTAVAVSTLESLHSSAHRPGRPDDDFLDDEAGGPRLPPRGLLANGEVIDMDDNDLDIAASMMAGLSLGRGMTPAPERSMENGFENSSLHTRESMLGSALHKLSSGTYLFDDPLGGENHGFAHFDEDDNSSGASTMTGTEEDDRSRPEDDGVPVMDLFAGQFSFDSPAFSSNVPATAAENTFAADFANFDDAFTANFIAADEFPALVEEPPAAEVSSSADNKPILEELFGGAKDHSILLEESLKEEQPTETATSNDAPDPSGGGDGDDSSDEE